MNSKISLSLLLSLMCILTGSQGSDSKSKFADELVRDTILQRIEDPSTARLQNIKLADLEKVIQAIRPFRITGFARTDVNLMEFSYRFIEPAGTPEVFGFEILAAGKNDKFGGYGVVNVRLVYLSPSGLAYYNSILNTPWLSEK